MAKRWIQKATSKNKGALRRQLGAKKGRPIPKRKLRAAAKKGGKTGRRARLALTLSKMKRRRSSSRKASSRKRSTRRKKR